MSENACDILLKRTWPGNVRMLENTIVRSMIMQEHDGPLENIAYDEECPELFPENTAAIAEEKPMPVKAFECDGDLVSQVAYFEQQLITKALNLANSNVAEAAKRLGISRTTLHYKIKKYAIRLGVLATHS